MIGNIGRIISHEIKPFLEQTFGDYQMFALIAIVYLVLYLFNFPKKEDRKSSRKIIKHALRILLPIGIALIGIGLLVGLVAAFIIFLTDTPTTGEDVIMISLGLGILFVYLATKVAEKL